MKGPSPRGLWKYATRRLRLAAYFRAPGDGRSRPQIPAPTLLWSILIGFILRQKRLSGHRGLGGVVGATSLADQPSLWR